MLALELLQREDPDFIVLDLYMPQLSGPDALAAIRRSPTHADIPVMCVSASPMRAVVAQVMALGVQDLVAKPMQQQDVLRRLDKMIRHAERWRKGRGPRAALDAAAGRVRSGRRRRDPVGGGRPDPVAGVPDQRGGRCGLSQRCGQADGGVHRRIARDPREPAPHRGARGPRTREPPPGSALRAARRRPAFGRRAGGPICGGRRAQRQQGAGALPAFRRVVLGIASGSETPEHANPAALDGADPDPAAAAPDATPPEAAEDQAA